MGHIALPLVNGWTAYGGDYGTPDYTVRNGMCSLEGLLYKSGSSPTQQLALLPEDCRPGAGSEELCQVGLEHLDGNPSDKHR